MDAALAAVGGAAYADAPVGRLSGGEQQRLRVAQALVGDPDVLLCDEPLLSLDLSHQRTVTRLIDERRRAAGTAVLFVTHEINPVLPLVDRVLYLVDGRFRIGPPEEVMTSEVLSELYRTDVDVLRVRGRLVVVGAEEHGAHCHEEPDRDADRCSAGCSPSTGIGELLALPFVQSALIACAVLGLVAGRAGPADRLARDGVRRARHRGAGLHRRRGRAADRRRASGSGRWPGRSSPALVFGLLGLRQRERDSVIGVVLAFGLGLGVLLLALYSGRASNKFGLLTGSIVSVDSTNLRGCSASSPWS